MANNMRTPPPPTGMGTPPPPPTGMGTPPPPTDYDPTNYEWPDDDEYAAPSPSSVPPIPDHMTEDEPETNTEPVSRPAPVKLNIPSETNYIPSKKVDFVCPYCMREIYTGDLLYFCKRCKTAYTEAEAQNAGLSRVVKKQYYCHNDSITFKRICPNCKIIAEHNHEALENLRLIPKEVYNVKNEFRVCMTGYSASGKTQYITRLMDYIVKYSLPSIDVTYFLDNKTQEIREAIRNRFFVDGKISATSSGYLEPLLFDIKKGKRSYVSVFYDIAGEDFRENRDTLATRCIWNSRNILLVIDPTTLPGIGDHPRVREFRAITGKASAGEVIEPLNTYIGFVSQNHPRGEKALKKVNLAIVFPKMDLFYDDDDFPEILKRQSSHIEKGQFVFKEVTAVSDAMRQWIRQYDGEALLNALRQYPSVQIFGVSSGSDDLSKKSDTNRLLDPYLWLLYQNDILK